MNNTYESYALSLFSFLGSLNNTKFLDEEDGKSNNALYSFFITVVSVCVLYSCYTNACCSQQHVQNLENQENDHYDVEEEIEIENSRYVSDIEFEMTGRDKGSVLDPE